MSRYMEGLEALAYQTRNLSKLTINGRCLVKAKLRTKSAKLSRFTCSSICVKAQIATPPLVPILAWLFSKSTLPSQQELCQVATTLLHYFVLACFSWLTADQYFIFKSVVKMKPYVNFMKIFVAAWGFPVPFLVMQLLIGFLFDQDIGSVLYSCWGSDFVALTLLIPAGFLSIASITMLTITVKAVIKRPAPTTYTRRKTDQAIKYYIKTSSIMIFIAVIVWIFAHLLFWYPDHIDFQLIFALSSGLQGLFNFFFYCVFALELDIYVSDKLFSETDDVDEFTRNTGSVKLSSINRQDIQNMESLRRPNQKRVRKGPFFREDHDLPPMIEEDESIDNDDGEDPYMGILGDDADPPLFLKPLPQVQQVQEEEDTPKPSDASPSSRKESKQSDPRRSSSLPSCSVPTPNRYVSATDSPGSVFPGGMSDRLHEKSHKPLRVKSKSPDIESSYSHGLFGNEDDDRSIKMSAPSSLRKMNGQSRASVPSVKSDRESRKENGSPNEMDRTSSIIDEILRDDDVKPVKSANKEHRSSGSENEKEKEDAANTTIMQVQPFSNDDEGHENGGQEPQENNSGDNHNTPATSTSHEKPQKQQSYHRSNSMGIERCFTHSTSGGTGEENVAVAASPSPTKLKGRIRTSVPSSKVALNELESLFSNQDLISAAGRKISGQSETLSTNEQQGEGK
eukprot:Seg1287.7 transcript_id=Seg1287.7/GoldUCD/mRNA.D3Y31 product="Adhesion G-protein coupled receptor D1" protein_id=Seg1287.7/GoldUCD/D3Y31